MGGGEGEDEMKWDEKMTKRAEGGTRYDVGMRQDIQRFEMNYPKSQCLKSHILFAQNSAGRK